MIKYIGDLLRCGKCVFHQIDTAICSPTCCMRLIEFAVNVIVNEFLISIPGGFGWAGCFQITCVSYKR